MPGKAGPYFEAWRRYQNIRGLMDVLLYFGWIVPPIVFWKTSHAVSICAALLVLAMAYALFVKAVSFPCPRCGKELGPMKRGPGAALWRRPGSTPLFVRWACPHRGLAIGDPGL
jgi:hypothetical protein